jgi:hypothetical protein
MAASKQVDARERRSKIALGVLVVILLGVVALEVPKFMGGAHHAATPPATTTTATTSTTSAAQTAPVAALASVAASQPKVTFSRFRPGDPFHAQVKDTSGTTGASGSTTTPPKQAAQATKTPAKAPLLILIGPKVGAKTPAVTTPAAPTVPGAFLRLNGRKVLVALDDVFPKKKPLFRLISLSRKAVWLQLLSGSFPDGTRTIKLAVGTPLRLRNQTDASLMVLKMVRPVTMPAPVAAPAAGSAG